MFLGSINWLAMIACLVFNIVSGALWYGPKTFFPVWWKGIGKSEKDIPNGKPLTWVIMILAGIIQIIFVYWIIKMTASTNAVAGILTGFFLWLGFVASTSIVTKLFPGRMKIWVIESGHHLINFIVFGAILGAWH